MTASTPSTTAPDASTFDVDRIRADFPILSRTINGKPLVYLDNAATSQHPRAMIDAITNYYENTNANIHRGVHTLSMEATDAFEQARDRVRGFLNAERPEDVIFVRGATEGVNLVAQAWARTTMQPGDEVVITTMEHHANIVPWHLLREQHGVVVKVAPIDDRGVLDLDALDRLITERTKLVGVVHVSNALGTVNPVKQIAEMAHARGAKVLVDGAQATPHLPVDVRELGADFYVVSAHKMFGPTGVGALYMPYDLQDETPPYQGGGEMILSVSFDEIVYNRPPHKFEAGTPDISGVVGWGATIDYLNEIGMSNIAAYEHDLAEYGRTQLAEVPGLRFIGEAPDRASVLSFVMDGAHPHDIGTFLDQDGIAIRTGHHCAQPVMTRFGIPATARASVAFYNTRAELDTLAASLRKVAEVFGG